MNQLIQNFNSPLLSSYPNPENQSALQSTLQIFLYSRICINEMYNLKYQIGVKLRVKIIGGLKVSLCIIVAP